MPRKAVLHGRLLAAVRLRPEPPCPDWKPGAVQAQVPVRTCSRLQPQVSPTPGVPIR